MTRARSVLLAAEAVGDDIEDAASARVDPRIALPLEKRQHFRFGEVLGYRHRKRDDEPRIAGGRAALGQRFVDRLRRIADDLAAAAAAVELRGARVQQLQVVGELGHRAHRRARRAHRIGLVDRDRRRNAFDPVDLRLVHPVEELPRVRRERLDVAPLSFGVQRVEDRGLPTRPLTREQRDELS